MFARLPRFVIALAVGCLLTGNLAAAKELQWDPSVYESLAPADSSDTIAPGTKITLQNWQRYKRFLAYGTQLQYSGRYFWHLGGTPDFTITVGPTQHVTLPRQFLEDTQKYGGQAKLERVDTGGFTIIGYVAGVPFPSPAEPDMATKVLYNVRYSPSPALSVTSNSSFFLDKFLNLGQSQYGTAFFKLNHISVAGMPVNPPYGNGYFASYRIFITAPEQARYLTQLNLYPDDPSVPQEIYVFVPSLRRPIRLSSSARCAPVLGSDTVNDDLGIIVTNFKFAILGEKRILVMMHPSNDPAVLYNPDSIHIRNSLPGWPKPALGKWELRDVYVLDATPLPVMGRYCYGHRVAYIDKETWLLIPGEFYDADGKLWKLNVANYMVIPDNTRDGSYIITHSYALLNVRESHVSGNILNSPVSVDNNVPQQYRNASVEAFPGSLHSIMR